MKIVHFSETDIGSGANISPYRLHRALLARAVDSVLLVSRKFAADPTVREAFSQSGSTLRRRLRKRLDRVPLAHRLCWALAYADRSEVHQAAREAAEEQHDSARPVERYFEFYREFVGRSAA